MKLKISSENNEKNIQEQSPRGFLTKWQNGILQICSKFTGELPNLLFTFMKTTHIHGYSPVKSLSCLQNTSGGLLLNIEKYPRTLEIYG